ncbi:MAG: hypothetical protein AUJ92_18730 [Armatimonadetes bacterium CG2_30_59_28]|nr:MAG: hypothetical protein AUJ92_18730 [Armatimonadetes bacterium CG2_30_59_28]PIU65187.1 MAG: hypothetical protein COS85_09765 [Armatimonadetes bacterium CG07_land_8_20_14_0_80_59_28]PIX42166.1 MAG: hypothetical protein COZ56_10000 [Armatimonadetes bacterium CG_4_8_14_3_um_filter_58_9]
MTQHELNSFSKAELIAIVLQQQKTIARLEARIADLEEQVQRLSAPPKTPANSSLPSSKGYNRTHRVRAESPR